MPGIACGTWLAKATLQWLQLALSSKRHYTSVFLGTDHSGCLLHALTELFVSKTLQSLRSWTAAKESIYN